MAGPICTVNAGSDANSVWPRKNPCCYRAGRTRTKTSNSSFVILRIDGSEMNDYRNLIMWMRLTVVGQEVLFEIETPDGETREVKVVLGNRGSYRGSLIN